MYKEKACEIDKQYDYCSIVSFMIGIGMSFMTKNYLAYQLTIMFYLLGTFFMCRRLVRKKRWIGFCKKFIPFVFMIYVLHGKILSILQILYSKVLLSTSMIIMGYFLIPFVCIFICCAFAVIYRKLLPKLYSIFIGELK